MRYLVTEIYVNYGKPLHVKLPTVYCEDEHLPVVFLRTEMFHCCDVRFLATNVEDTDNGFGLCYLTGYNTRQPLNSDVSDALYDDYVSIVADILHPRQMIVDVDEVDYKAAINDYDHKFEAINQVVFDALMIYMPVSFYIRQRK